MDISTYPILDFDPAKEAIIEPSRIIKKRDYSPKVQLCFFGDVIESLVQTGAAVKVDRVKSEMGENPIYQVELNGQTFMMLNPGIGAPLSAASMEEMIARGCNQFIACGGCGVLDREIAVGHILVIQSAVRDEGTSYAYLPPAVEVMAHPKILSAIERTLNKNNADYRLVKTWTTDAIYRETIDRTRLRKSQGCAIVEMEASAFMAVAQFRGVEFGQIVYGGDSVQEEGWDSRDWNTRGSIRKSLFWLAAEALIDL